MIGIVTAQLFRIELSPPTSSGVLEYYNLGVPLGAFFQAAAMVYVVIGCHRYLRQQLAMARGKVWASGWELYVIMVGTLLVSPAHRHYIQAYLHGQVSRRPLRPGDGCGTDPNEVVSGWSVPVSAKPSVQSAVQPSHEIATPRMNTGPDVKVPADCMLR